MASTITGNQDKYAGTDGSRAGQPGCHMFNKGAYEEKMAASLRAMTRFENVCREKRALHTTQNLFQGPEQVSGMNPAAQPQPRQPKRQPRLPPLLQTNSLPGHGGSQPGMPA
jgi:hypothetical protein